MSIERRYGDDEVAEIFERATAPGAPRTNDRTSAEGLTLSELQAIGREVGLEPRRIAEAAATLDAGRGGLQRRTDFGLPVGVGRSIALPRAPTDREWEILVGTLRETFDARGKESSHGDLRQWTNGNLHALIERTDTGYRLRMGTVKGSARSLNRAGLLALATSLFVLVVALLNGGDPSDLAAALFFGLAAPAAFVYNALRLPRWVQERERQMENIAGQALILIGSDRAPERSI